MAKKITTEKLLRGMGMTDAQLEQLRRRLRAANTPARQTAAPKGSERT